VPSSSKAKPRSVVWQFKVSLKEIQPLIWRRIQVPASYTFWDLHVAIQDAMGWQDYHLHEFTIYNPKTRELERIGIADDEAEAESYGGRLLPGWEERISSYFSTQNPTADYLYDFGDDWQHLVTLEESLPRNASVRYPVCVAGERACPPEDCGGVSGYAEFLEAIADPRHPEHKSMLKWVGGSFGPVFRPERVKFDNPRQRWRIAFAGGS